MDEIDRAIELESLLRQLGIKYRRFQLPDCPPSWIVQRSFTSTVLSMLREEYNVEVRVMPSGRQHAIIELRNR